MPHSFQNRFRFPRLGLAGVLAAALLAAGLAEAGHATTHAPENSGLKDLRGAVISGDPNKPRRHFRIRNPKQLTPGEAQTVYDGLRKAMGKGYAFSGHPAVKGYQKWRRYNTTPYRSSSHGQRYLNIYANAKGAAYGLFEKAGRLPVGSTIVKDSFTVMDDGAVSPGPVFIMEKMKQGFHYVSGDWRYTMIMPDGSIFGQTKGENAEAVEFCISCHLAAAEQDHLRFVPKAFRATAN